MEEAKQISTGDKIDSSSTGVNNYSYEALNVEQNKAPRARRRRCIAICVSVVLLILLLFIVVLVLALTIFKPKDPITELVSASVDGVSPRVTLPAIRIEINVTLDLKILVRNRNYASFRHTTGTSLLTYRGKRVGEAEIFPGRVPARGSATVQSRLTLEIDELGSEMGGLIADVIAGEIAMEAATSIPGRITFLGFIKKHAVALSECRFTIGVSDMKVRSQECKNRTKL